MVGPWITFVRKVRRQVSDIEYLATIESGNGSGNSILKNNEGSRTTAGTLATVTPTGTDDLYLAGASISHEGRTTGNTVLVVELRQNGTVIETFRGDRSVPSDTGATTVYHFNQKGHKVDGSAQTWTLEVISIGTGDAVEGNIECIEIDDGVSPRLP